MQDGVRWIRGSDVPTPSPEAVEAQEYGYRKGACHALAAAVDFLCSKEGRRMSTTEAAARIEEVMDGAYRWRRAWVTGDHSGNFNLRGLFQGTREDR